MASGDAEIVANRVPGPEGESLSPVEVTEKTISFDEFQERYRLPWQRSAEKDIDAEMLKISESLAASPNPVTGRTLFNPAMPYAEFMNGRREKLVRDMIVKVQS